MGCFLDPPAVFTFIVIHLNAQRIFHVRRVHDRVSVAVFVDFAACRRPTVQQLRHQTCTAWVKKFIPLVFLIFCQLLRILKQNFTRLLYVNIYVKLSNCMQLSLTLTK